MDNTPSDKMDRMKRITDWIKLHNSIAKDLESKGYTISGMNERTGGSRICIGFNKDSGEWERDSRCVGEIEHWTGRIIWYDQSDKEDTTK